MSNNDLFSKRLESLFSDASAPAPDAPAARAAASASSITNEEQAAWLEAQRFFEMALDILCIIGPDGRFHRVSSACEPTLGWTPAELSKRLFLELVHPEDVAATVAEFEKLAQGAVVIRVDNRYRGKNGAYRRLAWRAQTDRDGMLYATAREVPADVEPTPAPPAAPPLDVRLHRWEAVYNLSTEAIVIHEKGKVLDANRAAARMFGYEDVSEVLGRNIIEFVASESRPTVIDHIRTGYDKPYEVMTMRRDGSAFFVEAVARNYDVDGHMLRMAAFRDITERKQAEEELRRSKAVLEDTLEYMDQGISIVDADLNMLVTNRRFQELLDFPEWLCRPDPNRKFDDFIRYNAERGDYGPGDVEEQVWSRVELARQFQPHQLERERPDGTVLEIRGTPIPGRGFVTIYTDITKRAQAEKALREVESIYRRAIASADAVTYSRRYSDESFTFMSDGILAVTGYTAQEMTPRLLDSLIKEVKMRSSDSTHAEAIRQARAGESAHWQADYRILTRDGQTRWVADTSVEIVGPDGKSTGSVGILLDITERKQVEQSLRESEEHFRAVTESANVAIITADSTGSIVAWNASAERIFGYSAAEMMGQSITSLMPERYRDLHAAGIRRVSAGGEMHVIGKTVELSGIRKDGREFPLELSLSTWETGQGKFYTAILYDITDRKQTEAEINRRNDELAALNRVVATAASSLDLRMLLRTTAQEMVQLLNLRNSGIAILEPGGQHLTVIADYNRNPDDPSAEGVILPVAGNPSAQSVLEHKRSIVIADAQTDPLTAPIHDLMRARQTRGLMIVPLLRRGDVIGTIGCDDTDPHRRFTPHEVELAETMAGQLAGAIDTIRLFEDAQRRANELAAVAHVSTVATNVLNPQELLQSVVDLTKQDFRLYHAHVYLLNEAGDTLVLTAGAGEIGQQMVGEGRRIPMSREQSLVAQAARNHRGVVVNDVRRDSNFLPHPLLPETHSEMAIPLLVGGQVLGVLDVQSEVINRFNDNDVQIMSTLAAQVAVALQNARSFERSEKALAELNTLTRRLSHEGWQTYLKEQGPAVPGYVYDLAQVKPLEPDELPEGAADAGLKVPLVVQGEAIGQLAVAEGAELDTDSTEIISAVAERLSAHLENLRLTEQTQAALSSTQALYDLAAQLNAAASLDHILKITATADDAAGGALYTFELDPHGRPEALVVAALWSTSSTPVQVGDRIPLSQFPSAGDWLADPETPRLVSNFATAPNLDAATAASYQQSGVKAAVFLPLAVGSRWVGLLTLAWAEPRNFSASDEQRYKAMADQAATVVNNRLLFEQEQKYAAQLARLSQMEGSLSQAQTEQDVLNAFLVNLGLPPEASLSLSYLHNNTAGQPEAYDLVEVWSNGAFRSETTEQPRNVPLAALPISPLWLEQPDEVLYIDDVTTDPRVTDAIQAQAHRQGWQSEVVIPLHSSNAWQGLLTINWPRPRVLSDEDMKLFAQLMDPLAAVVATRRAYLAQAAAQREAERRAQREQLLREITAKLAATSDMESVMRVAAQELGQALGRQTFVVLDTPESSMAAKN